jgi:IS5 family transposase
VADVTQVDKLLRPADQDVYADAGYQGAQRHIEHPFRVIKQQFGFTKAIYRGLAKNAAKLHTLFMLSNLWMVRKWPQAWEPKCV